MSDAKRYTIQCDSIEHLTEVCASLVTKGICFQANVADLLITLTGGY